MARLMLLSRSNILVCDFDEGTFTARFPSYGLWLLLGRERYGFGSGRDDGVWTYVTYKQEFE